LAETITKVGFQSSSEISHYHQGSTPTTFLRCCFLISSFDPFLSLVEQRCQASSSSGDEQKYKVNQEQEQAGMEFEGEGDRDGLEGEERDFSFVVVDTDESQTGTANEEVGW